VIVPTVGRPDLVLGCVQRLLDSATVSFDLILMINPVDDFKNHSQFLARQVQSIIEAYDVSRPNDQSPKIGYTPLITDEAIGWIGAVNHAVDWLVSQEHKYTHVCIMNDDALPTRGWLAGLREAFNPVRYATSGNVNPSGFNYQPADDGCTKIGMVGPVSNTVAGMQRVQVPSYNLQNGEAFVVNGQQIQDGFANSRAAVYEGAVLLSSFLSGFCVMYDWRLIEDVYKQNHNEYFLDPALGIGGFDDNDIAVKAANAGWRLAIAQSVYVHHIAHQTLDNYFPEAQRGLGALVPFLKVWEEHTTKDQSLIAVYRVAIKTVRDLVYLRNSIQRASSLVDGFAVLLTNDPADALANSNLLTQEDRDFLWLCKEPFEGTEHDRAHYLSHCFSVLVQSMIEGEKPTAIAAHAKCLQGHFNERDERNTAIRMAYELDADWCISIDHDEVIEPRVKRSHLVRAMQHPNPMVGLYDFGWVNHWNTPFQCRTDQPWADGYKSSMRGYRMWRVRSTDLDQIHGGNEIGLHCGNVPDRGVMEKRVLGIRFRHYGYMMQDDRVRKYVWYNQIDTSPDATQTLGYSTEGGGNYNHLVNEERISIQGYTEETSIGFTMMYHQKESIFDLYRHLDYAHGVADHIVIVWTEPEGVEPDEDTQYIVKRFGGHIVHHPMNDHMGETRNAGLRKLRELGADWCWVMDPDEHFSDPNAAAVSIRRMVETLDGWAWMFRFKNYRADGNFSYSENTRLFRLKHDRLWFHDRVHETLERSFTALGKDGIHPQVRFAPFVVEHFGLNSDGARTHEKLSRYTRLLVKQITDNPAKSAGAWTSLGLQYGNDGDLTSQMRCYEVAMRTAGNAYLPFREAALFYLRQATKLLSQAHDRLAPSHDLHRITKEQLEVLTKIAPSQPILDTVNGRKATEEISSLDLNDLIRNVVMLFEKAAEQDGK